MKNQHLRLYRFVSLAMAAIFAAVGLVFLFLPDQVLDFFNRLSPLLGLPPAPVQAGSFYPVLAVAYMYLVTLLAGLMFSKPGNPAFPLLLVPGEACQLRISLVLLFRAAPRTWSAWPTPSSTGHRASGPVAVFPAKKARRLMANLTLKLLLAVLPSPAGKKAWQTYSGLRPRLSVRRSPLFTASPGGHYCKALRDSPGSRPNNRWLRARRLRYGKNLYDRSLRLGRDIRSQLPIRSRTDATATLHCLYGLLDIDKQVDAGGTVTIRRCFLAVLLHSRGLPLHVGHGRGHRRRPVRRPAHFLTTADRGRGLLPGAHRMTGRDR